jgi:hypothetical protein
MKDWIKSTVESYFKGNSILEKCNVDDTDSSKNSVSTVKSFQQKKKKSILYSYESNFLLKEVDKFFFLFNNRSRREERRYLYIYIYAIINHRESIRIEVEIEDSTL